MDQRAEVIFKGIKSSPWSKAALAFCAGEMILTAVYVVGFFGADPDRLASSTIVGVRSWLLPLIPFILLLHFFVLGLWVHALYADMFHLFHNTNLNPQRAMLQVLLPVVNIYGIGMNLSRVAAEADRLQSQQHQSDKSVRSYNRMIRYGLAVFYAALGAILLAVLLYSFQVSFNAETLANDYFKVFNGVHFVAIAGAITGLAFAILGSQGLVLRVWKTERHQAMN